MTETIRKALDKAMQNGFLFKGHKVKAAHPVLSGRIKIRLNIAHPEDESMSSPMVYDVNTVIFSHGFAIAFWGGEDVETGLENPTMLRGEPGGPHSLPAYIHHLQQMVLHAEPVEYLKQFTIA